MHSGACIGSGFYRSSQGVIMKNQGLSLGEFLWKLEQAQEAIDKAVELLHDTGDFESEELDEATTKADKVADLIRRAYQAANVPQ